MRRHDGVLLFFALGALGAAGCAKVCEFGQGDGVAGLKCYSIFSKAEVGMTASEVEQAIGAPQSRKFDVAYKGKIYDEVWVYNTTVPTILYFRQGVLEDKEYQQ